MFNKRKTDKPIHHPGNNSVVNNQIPFKISPATEKYLKKIEEIESTIQSFNLSIGTEDDQALLLKDLNTIRHLLKTPNYNEKDVLERLMALNKSVKQFSCDLVERAKENIQDKIKAKFKEGENIEDLERKAYEMETNTPLFARNSPPVKTFFFTSMLCCFSCCNRKDEEDINNKKPLLRKSFKM